MTRSRVEKRQAREAKLTDGGEAFMPDDHSAADSSSTWGVVNVDSIDDTDPTEELRVPSSKLPWAICECGLLQALDHSEDCLSSFREWWSDD